MSEVHVIQKSKISFDEICHLCSIESEVLITMVDHGVIEPEGTTPEVWYFSEHDLYRLHRAKRLQRDLQINMEATGLVLDLIDELDQLRLKIERLEHE